MVSIESKVSSKSKNPTKKALRDQEDLVYRLTDRLVKCYLDQFSIIQKELFAEQNVLKDMKLQLSK